MMVMMTPRTRDLMFKTMDGNLNLIPVMEYIWNFRRCDLILYWCIQNRMTGKNLEEWIQKRWRHSRLSMVKFILMKLDKSPVPQPVFLGEEYQPRG